MEAVEAVEAAEAAEAMEARLLSNRILKSRPLN